MRNSTKLKVLLLKYTLSLDLDDDQAFVLLLINKANNETNQFHGKSYSSVLSLAYSFMLKELKRQEKGIDY
jgi:hypothetical protein